MNNKELLIDFIEYAKSRHVMPILHSNIEPLVDDYLSSKNDGKPIVSGALPLNGTKATELAQIGSKYVYEDALGYGRISEGGIFEIIKKYEEFRRQ